MQTEAVDEAAGPVPTSPVPTSPVPTSPVPTSRVPTSPVPTSPVPPSVAWTPPTWEVVVREHSARVYRLAYRLTGNCHDAEDLTQEVFVRVFRSVDSYTPGTFEG